MKVGFVALILLWGVLDLKAFTPEELHKIGERAYDVRGVNTCLSCHGQGGKGGTPVTEAARLDRPRDWKIYRSLGGDAALQKNPETFQKSLESAYVMLFQQGSLEWMKKNPTLNLQLNPLMYGVTQADTLKEIRKIKKEIAVQKGLELTPDQSKQLVAHALFQYIKTLDQGGPRGGVFK